MKSSAITIFIVIALHLAAAYCLSQAFNRPETPPTSSLEVVQWIQMPESIANTHTAQHTQEDQQPNIAAKPEQTKRSSDNNPTTQMPPVGTTKPTQAPVLLAVTTPTATEATTQPPATTVEPTPSKTDTTTQSMITTPSANTPATQISPVSTASSPPKSQVLKGETVGINADTAYLNNPKPEYPAESKDNGEEGIVYLNVKVSITGEVLEVKLHKSSGYSSLDRSALKSVKRWRFTPAKKEGMPVEAQAIVPIKFFIE